jgi:hypothetical protein
MPDDARTLANATSSYEADEHAWMAGQVAALAAGDWDRLDRPHLIEFLNDLARRAQDVASACYPDAVRRAARETGIPAAQFPAASPWTIQEALAFDPPEPVRRAHR